MSRTRRLVKAAYKGTAFFLGIVVLLTATPALAQEGTQAILNAVEAEQEPGQPAFNVKVFVSVLDGANRPITGLEAADFSLSEDGNAVDLLEVGPAGDSSNIVLVVDTSGSMGAEGKMDAVRAAASGFLAGLTDAYNVAIVTFNESIEVVQDFSNDHEAGASNVDSISAEPGTGACLYDAANVAVVKATTAPPGRRVIILLTDGVDELLAEPGSACSQRTLDEVVAFASGGTSRAPIYTIGVGTDVNTDELQQIAEETGGTFALAAGPEGVSSVFDLTSQQIKSQYALSYQSTATSGEHSLMLEAILDEMVLEDQFDYALPEPTLMSVQGVADGDTFEADERVSADVTVTGSVQASRVLVLMDGEVMREENANVLSVDLDAAALAAGEHTLTVQAELENNQVLSQAVTFEIVEAVVPPEEPVVVEEVPIPDEVDPAAPAGVFNANPVPFVAGAAILVVLVAVAVFGRRSPSGTIIGGASGYSGSEDMTNAMRVDDVVGTLSVRESVHLYVGQPFDLYGRVVRIGQAADNDIVIPDEGVSRHHAEIRLEDGRYVVFDLGSDSGTVVSNQPVGEQGTPLRNGDELVLGADGERPTRLTYNAFESDVRPGESALDWALGGDFLSPDESTPADSSRPQDSESLPLDDPDSISIDDE